MIAPCRKCGGERTPTKKGDGIRFRCRPCDAWYQRKNYAANVEKFRARKAAHMAKARRDPTTREKYLGYQRKAWRNGGSEKRKAWMRRLRTEDPWRWKALTIHTSVRGKLGADDLRCVWNRQGGICGITGQPLDFETAQVDHILPRSRGGPNTINNVRWATKEANEAKGNMTDEEFLTLCRQVAEWIGRRIMKAAAICLVLCAMTGCATLNKVGSGLPNRNGHRTPSGEAETPADLGPVAQPVAQTGQGLSVAAGVSVPAVVPVSMVIALMYVAGAGLTLAGVAMCLDKLSDYWGHRREMLKLRRNGCGKGR